MGMFALSGDQEAATQADQRSRQSRPEDHPYPFFHRSLQQLPHCQRETGLDFRLEQTLEVGAQVLRKR